MTLVDAVMIQSFISLFTGGITITVAASNGLDGRRRWPRFVLSVGICLVVFAVLGFSMSVWIALALDSR